VDDAAAFVAREGRRGREFDGVVLDPPTYGHGPGGRDWRLTRDLGGLIATIREVLKPTAFVLVTCHTPDVSPENLAGFLEVGLGRARNAVDRGVLAIETRDARHLVLGTFARFVGGA
jgi:23S rRNA (cytosine1962-C5)-methyltransferase